MNSYRLLLKKARKMTALIETLFLLIGLIMISIAIGLLITEVIHKKK